MANEAELKFFVKLDADNGPEEITWSASQSDTEGDQSCEALMVSMWDKSEKNTMSIDLWTKKMEVGDMNAHFYYTLMKMADTYLKATNNQELSDIVRGYAKDFVSRVDDFAKKED